MQIETLVVSSDKAEVLRMRQQQVAQMESQVQQLSQRLRQLQTQLKGNKAELEGLLGDAGCSRPEGTGDIMIPRPDGEVETITIAVEIKEGA